MYRTIAGIEENLMGSRRLWLAGFHDDGCSVSSLWLRPSQVRLARTANASINAGCGGVRFIGFGPIDGRRNGGKKRFARKNR
jgi:hypothetical protein